MERQEFFFCFEEKCLVDKTIVVISFFFESLLTLSRGSCHVSIIMGSSLLIFSRSGPKDRFASQRYDEPFGCCDWFLVQSRIVDVYKWQMTFYLIFSDWSDLLISIDWASVDNVCNVSYMRAFLMFTLKTLCFSFSCLYFQCSIVTENTAAWVWKHIWNVWYASSSFI